MVKQSLKTITANVPYKDHSASTKRRGYHKCKHRHTTWHDILVITTAELVVKVWVFTPKLRLTLMRSSFQNVNIHRTPEDALQTVPPHLWPPAVTLRGCGLCLSLPRELTPVVVSLSPACSQWWPSGWCASSYNTSATHTHTHTSVTLASVFWRDLRELNLNTSCVRASVFMSWKLHGIYTYIFLSVNRVISPNDHVTLCYVFDMCLYRAIIV